MDYKDQVCTIYRVENGFVVDCQEEIKAEKSSKKDACCPSTSSVDTKTFTAASPAAVLKIVKAKLSGEKDEYADSFDEAAAEK